MNKWEINSQSFSIYFVICWNNESQILTFFFFFSYTKVQFVWKRAFSFDRNNFFGLMILWIFSFFLNCSIKIIFIFTISVWSTELSRRPENIQYCSRKFLAKTSLFMIHWNFNLNPKLVVKIDFYAIDFSLESSITFIQHWRKWQLKNHLNCSNSSDKI